MKGVWTKLAVLIPLLGILALITRAEIRVRSGRTWSLPVTGYDPRDLVHGHYIRYRHEFNWSGNSSCGEPKMLEPGCCVCIAPGASSTNPEVRSVGCDEVSACEAWFPASSVRPPLRYLIPEQSGRDLEREVARRNAALEVAITPDGKIAIRDLLLDGRPWRDVVEEATK